MALLLLTATITPPPMRATSRAPIQRSGCRTTSVRFRSTSASCARASSRASCSWTTRRPTSLPCGGSPRRPACPSASSSSPTPGSTYPPRNGRAYGELRLLDHAMARSRLVAAAPPDTLVWKVTGRYIIENIERLMRRKDGAVLYCHCRNLPQRWADMYLLGWTKAGYAGTVQGASERVIGGAEVAFRALVDEKARSMRVVRRFPEPPRVRGIRGWDAKPYEADPLKTRIRAMLARAVPWLWI